MEKLLPQNIEAECGVLGSIIIDPEAIVQVDDFLLKDDFYRDAHQDIYESMKHLYEQGGPADFITLCDELERKGKLEDVGGIGYISSLTNQVPTSGNIEFYGHIVERTAILRRLIYAAGQIAAIAYEEADARAALDQAEQLIFHIGKRQATSDFTSGEDIASALLERLEYLQAHRGELLGVPTGYKSLDRLFGGFQNTDLIIVAGRPGMGKTSLALNFAYNALVKYNKRIGLFSLEMSKEQLMEKLFSMDSGIDSQNIRNGRIGVDDWQGIINAYDRFTNDNLWIDDTGAISIGAMRSKARRILAERKIDLFIVDYMQLMQAHTPNGKRYENRLQEVSEISAGLKALAKELNVPIIALSQLSRAVESRQSKVPQLSDLRESGTLEQDADIVMFVYRDDYYAGVNPDTNESLSDRPGTADIIVAKHRNGKTGETSLRFVESTTRFYSPEPIVESTAIALKD